MKRPTCSASALGKSRAIDQHTKTYGNKCCGLNNHLMCKQPVVSTFDNISILLSEDLATHLFLNTVHESTAHVDYLSGHKDRMPVIPRAADDVRRHLRVRESDTRRNGVI